MRRLDFFVILVSALLLVLASSAAAQEEQPPADATADTVAASDSTAGDKLMRGLSNTLLGWTEIPKQVVEGIRESDTDPVGGAVGGFVQGVQFGVAREVIGILELFTFPFRNTTGEGYRSSVSPEHPLSEGDLRVEGETVPARPSSSED